MLAEQALLDTRLQISAAPKSSPLVHTRTIGKAPTFTDEHKDWPERSFQCTAYMGSANLKSFANPKSIEALRWAAMDENLIGADDVETHGFEDCNAQLYLGLALLCKGSAPVTVKNRAVNNGLEAWRGLNAAYDSDKIGRQRVWLQYLLQPKRSESIQQTTEAVERWERDVRQYEQRFGKTLDEDVKIGTTLALAPPQVLNHCHLNSHILKSHAHVRTMLFDYCRAQANTTARDVVPMDLSMLGTGKKGKGNKRGKGKGKKGESDKDEKGKDKDKKGKGKVRSMPKRMSTLLGTVSTAKLGGHMKKDCWWNESATSGEKTASRETLVV